MPVDTTLKYRGYNSYLMAEGGEILYSDPFDVSLFSDVVAQLSAIKLGGTASLFVSFKFFDEENKIITPPDPVWTIDIIDRWTDYWRTIPVPSSAKTMQWRIQSVGWSKHIACPKISAGTMPTAFSDEATIRESYLTAEGLYTSTISANQVIAGILRAISGKAWFDLEKPEIVMQGKDGETLKSSPDNPLRIEDADGDLIGGLMRLGDQLRLIAGAITNKETADAYVEVGEIDLEGISRLGLRLMQNGQQVFSVVSNATSEYSSAQMRLLGVENFSLLTTKNTATNSRNVYLNLGVLTAMINLLGGLRTASFSVGSGGGGTSPTLQITENDISFTMRAGSTEANRQGIGIDATGPYRVKNGVKTYF